MGEDDAAATISLSGSDRLPRHLRGGVVAIGNFDGVHRGHLAVLEAALAEARRRAIPALVLTFEPHPRTFFRPASPVFRLTPPALKRRLLGALGFGGVVEQAFDAGFAARSATSFVEDTLIGHLGAVHVVAGHDFHFGHGREGTPDFLRRWGDANGLGITLVEPFRGEDGEVVSSSRIRDLLGEGNVAAAARILGYRYLVEAPVGNGRKLGRTLGYPTANMALPGEFGLRHGIYAVRYRRADGSLHDGVASFGRRPTVDEAGHPLLETHLFDFSGDVYGERGAVSFFAFLRGEEKFGDLDALVVQMRRDEENARAALGAVEPLSSLDRRLSFSGAQ